MGFFKDFKDDLSQAVNEMVTDPELEGANDTSSDVMVNTLDNANDKKDDNVSYVGGMSIDEQIAAAEAANNQEYMPEEKAVEETVVEEPQNEDEGVLDETAVITKGVTINGNMSARGSVDVLGCIEGNVECLGKLTVSGNIIGDSKSAELFANNAKINGNIISDGVVKVGGGSIVVGNITATSAVIAGAVKGDIDVQGPVIIDATAVIVGDIKSKSVQINNGAVIEGRCSQCYADNNPTSVFEL